MLGFSGVTAMMLRCRGSMVLCLDSNGNRTDTLLIGEAWNPTTGAKITPKPSNTITLACRTAALAKCVEFGYRPSIPTCGASFASGGLIQSGKIL